MCLRNKLTTISSELFISELRNKGSLGKHHYFVFVGGAWFVEYQAIQQKQFPKWRKKSRKEKDNRIKFTGSFLVCMNKHVPSAYFKTRW